MKRTLQDQSGKLTAHLILENEGKLVMEENKKNKDELSELQKQFTEANTKISNQKRKIRQLKRELKKTKNKNAALINHDDYNFDYEMPQVKLEFQPKMEVKTEIEND